MRGKSSTEASRSSAGSYAERPARADTTPPASTAPDPLGDAVGGSSGRSTNLRLSATSRLGLGRVSEWFHLTHSLPSALRRNTDDRPASLEQAVTPDHEVADAELSHTRLRLRGVSPLRNEESARPLFLV